MACFPVVFHGFANWGANQPYIRGGTLQGEYALETMHIHWGIKNETGSEHTLGGLHYPAEVTAFSKNLFFIDQRSIRLVNSL